MAEHVEAIGRRIRLRREELGLTQAELARKLPGTTVDGPQVSRWERGIHEPSSDHKEQIAKALDISVAKLLTDPPKAKANSSPREGISAERADRIEEMLEELLRRTAPPQEPPDTGPPDEGPGGLPPDEPIPPKHPPDQEDTGEAQTG